MRQLIERDLVAVYRTFTPVAVEIINKGRELAPQVIFVQMSKVRPGVIEKSQIFDPELVNSAHASSERKHLLMTMIKAVLGTPGAWTSAALAERLAADGFTPHIAVHLSEAWGVRRASPVMDKPPSQQPDRSEILMVGLHLRDRSYSKTLPITTTGSKRHCELQPWAPHDPNGALHIGGVFSVQQEELP